MDQQPTPLDTPASMPFRTDEMISAREVSRLTGLSRKRVGEAARLGHLTTLRPPAGVVGLVRYSRKSALALAASMLTPATATHPKPMEATDGV